MYQFRFCMNNDVWIWSNYAQYLYIQNIIFLALPLIPALFVLHAFINLCICIVRISEDDM